MKFAHLADCHLGAWRQPELNELNLQSFKTAINTCLKQKLDFILIAGDLFDSAYPSIETLKEAFKEFKKLKDSSIPVFIIAGSHDYSASGKSFLEVLEKAGFCRDVSKFEEKDNKIVLLPTIYNNVAIYGYPGKKSGLEVEELKKVKLQDCPGLFKILMLHTTLRSAVPNPNVKAVNDSSLPSADYFAMGHLHISYRFGNKVYPGPIFPNNILELEELKYGSFYIFDKGRLERQEIKLKQVLVIDYNIVNTLNLTDKILKLLEKEDLKEKIVIIKLSGLLETGKTSDMDFKKLESYSRQNKAFVLLKNTSKLKMLESEIRLDTINTEDIEAQIIKKFEDSRLSKFTHLASQLIKTLQIEKVEDEKSITFEERLLSENKNVIGI